MRPLTGRQVADLALEHRDRILAEAKAYQVSALAFAEGSSGHERWLAKARDLTVAAALLNRLIATVEREG